MTFEWWGRAVYRRRWPILLISLLFLAVLAPLARTAGGRLSAGGWIGEDTEAFLVDEALIEEFGRRSASHYLLFRDPTGELAATDPAFQAEVARTLAPLSDDPAVAEIFYYGGPGSEALADLLLSADGRSSLAVITLNVPVAEATEAYPDFRETVRSDRLEVLIGGWPAASRAFTTLAEEDLQRVELITLPVILVLLVLVFGSLVAAGLPLLVGGASIVATLAGIGLLSRFTETSVFVLNVATMLGLAISIDYALFLVSRYREEIRRPETSGEDALGRTMATAGQAIFVSGLTVAIGVAGLAFFPTPAMRSIAIGGALVVMLGVGVSLTTLAALLAILGHRVDRWRIPTPRWGGARTNDGFWHGLATRVMAHPVAFLVPALGVLLITALPFLNYRGGSPGMTMLPADQEARRLYDAIQTDFPQTSLSPVYVLLRPMSGAMTDPANLEDLRLFSEAVAARPTVRRVEGLWAYVDVVLPGASAEQVALGLTLREDWRRLAGRFLTEEAALLEVMTSGDDTDLATEDLVIWLRERGPALADGAFTLQVGGGTAVNIELVDGINGRAPLAVGFVLLVTYIVLFFLLGSVLLPLKAILMNLLSLSASYGALVWIFQEGHLARVIGFEPLGYTVATVPVMMFCFVFGLSMDYEVLMLTRIKEEYTTSGDNTLAVARGLEATGRVVTSAALIMVVVFGAFGGSRVLLVQSLGVGLALAVALDATLVRAILVPATMRLLGKWNWWAPGRPAAWAGRQRQPAPAQIVSPVDD